MPEPTQDPNVHPVLRMLRYSDVMIAFVVVGIIMMLIVPLPSELLDLLLVINIASSLITILISIQIDEPLQFSVFPTLLLISTLFRLALDVSGTRMILLHGHLRDPVTHDPIGAGRLIPAFGNVVVGGNLLVGLMMFVILILIQIMVITKGAERIAQVAARFSLDAMPMQQMAIDSELAAGNITADQARQRRLDVTRESDFFGSMDGAAKFVTGDALASVVIMIVNVVGGMLMGMLYHSMGASEAVGTFALLSIGNGLLTTLPAFLMSTSMAMVVSRAAGVSNLGDDIANQVKAQPQALKIGAAFLILLGVLGACHLFAFPPLPFFMLGGGLAYFASLLTANKAEVEQVIVEQQEVQKKADLRQPDKISFFVDPIALEVGRGLLSLVDPGQGSKLLERVTSIRRHIAMELGLLVPGVRFRDNLQLKPNVYVINIRELEVARGEIHVNQFLAIGPEEKLKSLRGARTVDPTYAMPAVWISPEQRGDAERLGCMIFDPVSVVATHLTETIRKYGYELLGRQEVQAMLDTVKKTHPAVVKDVVPEAISLGDLQRVLQNLVKERVSVRDLVRILEALSDHTQVTKDPDLLTEFVRARLAAAICKDYVDNEETINVITLEPLIEQAVQRSQHLEPHAGQEILQAISVQVRVLEERGRQPILLTSPLVRPLLRKLTERSFPNLVLLSWNEIAPRVHVQSVAMVSL